jgi:hypothetical protein
MTLSAAETQIRGLEGGSVARYRTYSASHRRALEHIRQHRMLEKRLGPIVGDIEKRFFALECGQLDEMLKRYGQRHGAKAESYARDTFQKWKSGERQMAGQTAQRLLDLMPRYLSTGERFEIVERLCKHHAPVTRHEVIIDSYNPSGGLDRLKRVITDIINVPALKYLPEHVIEDVQWLNEEDVSAARQMLSIIDKKINDIRLVYAKDEIIRLSKILQENRNISGSHRITFTGGNIDVFFRKTSLLGRLFRKRRM